MIIPHRSIRQLMHRADIISIRTVSRADILMIITIRAFSHSMHSRFQRKTPFIITACGIAVALVVAIAAFFIFNGLNKNTPQGQIQGTWIAEENGVSLQLEFKPDGTIGIPNAKELGKLISSYAGSSDYGDLINYDEIFNLIDMKYSIDDEKTLSISLEVSFVNQSQSQSLKWSDDPANGGSDTWGIDGDTLYIAGTKLTRINN